MRGEQADQQPADDPDRHALAPNVQPQGRSAAESAVPPTAEGPDDATGIQHAHRDAQQRPRDGQRQAFGQQRAPHGALRQAGREHEADLRCATVQREPQNRPCQGGARRDQEDAQAKKEPAEVGGALCGLQSPRAHRLEDHSRVFGLQEPRQLALEGGRWLLRREGDLQRGRLGRWQVGSRCTPHPLHIRQVQESLRRGAIALPVFLVARRDARQVHREGRLPGAHVGGVGQPFVVGHESRIGPWPGGRDDGRDPQSLRARRVRPVRQRNQVFQVKTIPHLGLQIGRQPVIEPHFAGARVRRDAGRAASERQRRVEAGDDRVSGLAGRRRQRPQARGEVDQALARSATCCFGSLPNRLYLRRGEGQGVAVYVQPSGAGFDGQAFIRQRHGLRECGRKGLVISLRRGRQQHVGFARLPKVSGQKAAREEDIARAGTLRVEAQVTAAAVRQDRPHDYPQRVGDFLEAAVAED